MYSPSATAEMNALNAAVEPMLMRASMMMQVPTRLRALSGIFRRELIFPKKLENGSPLSFENAQTRRETEANTLKNDMQKRMAKITTNKLVAFFEPVAR